MKPKIKIYKDLRELSDAAAKIFVDSVKDSISRRHRFFTALSGGNTPTGLYELLSQPSYSNQIDWNKVYIFWGDERCIPKDDPSNNYFQARQSLLSRVSIPEKNIYRIASELMPEQAARDYTRVLNNFAEVPFKWPRFDLVLLGMGDDGHTASLFPGSSVVDDAPAIAVTANYQDRPANRVSLTPLVFNAARRVIFLVVGQSKSETLSSVLNGEYRPGELPAQRIRPDDGEVIWLVDEAAASKL